ncbi:MAG TPA: chorismate-binding protein, partial [Thermoleophilia bacterium]|nr:chorismate-binding protein [Thermoleophilia bacterium]
HAPMPGLPEAAFLLYREGWLWEGGRLVSRPPSDSPLAALEAEAGLARLVDDLVPASDQGRPALLEPTVPPVALESDFTAGEFVAGVDEVQERIRQGWVYQVNLSHRFRFPAAAVDPLACYRRLRIVNPSPFMGLFEGDGWAVVSGSPERLYSAAPDCTVTARPIAGTRPRGATPEQDRRLEDDLRANVKEQAEHVMLVDLLRNDLSRVCAPGTVEVSEAFTVERYSHVMHLVSEVRGRLGTGPHLPRLADLTAAIFPGGTITGAPKESVMREIARLEPVPRGAYTGALGYVSRAGIDFNILIRSLTFAGGLGHVSAGGGIVIGSDAPDEYLETRHKAEALLHVLGSGAAGEPAAPPSYLRSWRPPPVRRRVADARVVFVEAHDSFSYNIVNYLEMTGARVTVVDHAAAPELGDASHVVVGPGPGEPGTSGRVLDWIRAALEAGVPLLGVCLGHQALGLALGARLVPAPRPVHGEDHEVLHTGRGLFAGLPASIRFTRYHSLCLTDLPHGLRVDARTADGTVMAIAVEGAPAWGVQFHPESMLSPHGLALLTTFLERASAAH